MIHSAQATLPNESDQLRLERHQGHSARSQVAHIDEVIHSAQATLPNKSDQLRLERHQGHSARSQVAYIDEVIHSAQATLPNESDQLRLERHQGHIARSPAAHFDEFVYSGQVTLPEELDQLRLYCHSATSPFGWNATKATAPGAQQLTLTSSPTLDRSCYLRSWINSGYTATWPQRPETSSSL